MGFFSELASNAKNAPPAEPRSAEPESKTAIQPKPGREESAPPEPAGETKPERETESAEQVLKNQEAAAEQDQLERLAAMSDQDAAALSVQRVSADTERLTRRNMKDCVSDHIQGMCREDPAFARRVLHPRKTMVNCFKYIYRKAQEFARQEMEDLGESSVNGVYGTDVPDGLCYQWAEAYFNDPDVPEDKPVSPKPAPGVAKAEPRKPAKKQSKKPKAAIEGQISLLGEAT